MSLQAKREAVAQYKHLVDVLGRRPKSGPGALNLRKAKISEVLAAQAVIQRKIDSLIKLNGPIQQKPKVAPFPKDRSKLISLIKALNPRFKSKRTDTYDSLLSKYRSNLPKRSFTHDIENRSIRYFLEHPEDESEFTVDAKVLVRNIKHLKEHSDFYLVMSTSLSSMDSTGEVTESVEYKVIKNIDAIAELLHEIDDGEPEVIENMTYVGSDIEFVIAMMRMRDRRIDLKWYSLDNYRRSHSGAYFKWYNRTILDLKRYQIFQQDYDSKKEDSINCLIYALKMSNKISTSAIDTLKLKLVHREIKLSDIKNIAVDLDCTIKVRYDMHQAETVYNKGRNQVISIGLVDNHFFINEPTKITRFALSNYDEAVEHPDFPLVHPSKHKQKPLSSFQVVSLLINAYKDTMLEPITLSNISNKLTVDKLADYDELRAPSNNCDCGGTPNTYEELKDLIENCDCSSKRISREFRHYGCMTNKKIFRGFFKNPKSDPNNNFDVWFIDTETFISKKEGYHVANTLCAIRYSLKAKAFIEYTFFGLDCVEQFLKNLRENAVIYAHNMAFDFRVFIDHLYDLHSPLESGTKLKQIQGKYRVGSYLCKKTKTMKDSYIHLCFKDSYAFLPVKLANLPAMLELDTGDKDAYPYTLVNEYNYDQKVKLSICRKHVKAGQRKIFTDNARRIGALDDQGMVDMKKYTIHYCMQDTRILAHGFIKFREQILTVCKLDIFNRVSLPQLADDFLKSQGVYDEIYSISGIAQDFIRRCCVGGRVMTNGNQKWHVKCNSGEATIISNAGKGAGCVNVEKRKTGTIADFDAVSLYPSAMAMLPGYSKGLPKVLNAQQIADFDAIRSQFNAYYVEIEVTSHTIDRDFPLQSIKDCNGIRNFTNQIDNQQFTIDNIALEDLIKFQGVSYRVLRGYYMNDGYNTKIHETINFMFDERLRLKKAGNNLQNVFKLLMNSSYGRLLIKAILKTKVFVDAAKLRGFVAAKHKYIDSYSKINDDLYAIKVHQSVNEHFTCVHIAANVLSMSKRLMNRVMCLAEDIGTRIYYQDTDSMHLHESDIPALSAAFEEKYATKLIGKKMGQFHTDFSVSDSSAKNIEAVESIFLGKKCYIDKLRYTNAYGNRKTDFHVRVKGIPSASMRDFDADVMGTYMRLFNGERLEFDLSAYCPLQIDSDYRARANTKCLSRTLKF